MGTSKRYAHHYDALMENKIAEGIMRTGQPETLDAKQLAPTSRLRAVHTRSERICDSALPADVEGAVVRVRAIQRAGTAPAWARPGDDLTGRADPTPIRVGVLGECKGGEAEAHDVVVVLAGVVVEPIDTGC